MGLPSFVPGFIESYDAARRICRVRIPGLTDGAEVFPEASICNPIGDKSEHTELRIVAGDRGWLSFVDGDARFPIIVGYRPKETDNVMGWRRWHHANVEVTADGQVLIQAGASVTLRSPSIVLDGNVSSAGSLTNNGTNVGSTHRHGGVDTGGGTTQTPQ